MHIVLLVLFVIDLALWFVSLIPAGPIGAWNGWFAWFGVLLLFGLTHGFSLAG